MMATAFCSFDSSLLKVEQLLSATYEKLTELLIEIKIPDNRYVHSFGEQIASLGGAVGGLKKQYESNANKQSIKLDEIDDDLESIRETIDIYGDNQNKTHELFEKMCESLGIQVQF